MILNNKGFFNPEEKKDGMIDNIYSIYNKMDLTKKELNMLWGMHKKLKKISQKFKIMDLTSIN